MRQLQAHWQHHQRNQHIHRQNQSLIAPCIIAIAVQRGRQGQRQFGQVIRGMLRTLIVMVTGLGASKKPHQSGAVAQALSVSLSAENGTGSNQRSHSIRGIEPARWRASSSEMET